MKKFYAKHCSRFVTASGFGRMAFLILLLAISELSFGQILAWQFGSPASAGSEATFTATTKDGNLSNSSLSRGAGVAASALGRAFCATGFDASATKATAITNNEFIAFTVNAASGYQVSLSTLNVRLRRSGTTAPNAYIWRYSTNGSTFTDIGTDISFTSTVDGVDQAQIDLSVISALQNVPNATTITFRLYAWGGTNAGATFSIGRYGTGVTTNSLSIGGTVTASGPAISTSATSLTGFTYIFGNGPSTSQSYTVSGSNLSPASGNISITAPADYEVSSDNSSFTNTYNIGYTGGALSATTVYTRLKTGLAVGNYNAQDITNAGGGATDKTVALSGSVTAVVVPTVTLTSPSAITEAAASAGGNVTATGGATVSAKGVVWNTTTPVTLPGLGNTNDGTGVGSYTSSLSSLAPETRYYMNAYATNIAGNGYGTEQSFYTLSNAPTGQATNLIGVAASSSQVDLSWDPAVFPASGATVKGYVLVRTSNGSAPTFNAADGAAPGTSTGNGSIVSTSIYDPSNVYSDAGVTQLTTYRYLLVPYTWDGTNSGTYHYLTAGALLVSASTPLGPCTPPVTSASAAAASTPTTSSLNISWTNGSGDRVLVIVREATAVSVTPVTGTIYSASNTYGAGDNLGSLNYVCYDGTGTNFTLAGLTAGTSYHIAVFTYNVSGYCYKTTSPATASNTTTASGALIETFEPGVKGAYATGTATCNLGTWNFTDALIGSSASDRFVDTKSARIQNTGTVTMLFDKTNGLGTVTVRHAIWGIDGSSTWQLEVSDNGGATYDAYVSPVQTTATTNIATTASFTVNLTGNNIRVRIVKLSGGGNRINIDNISLGDYVATNAVTTSAISGSPFCITNASGTTVTVPFTATGTYGSGNVYTAQLSDVTGSFSLPVDIGTLASSANSGSITATIPAGTATGASYKIRVIASDPSVTGSASATVLSVYLNTPDVSLVNVAPISGQVTISWTNPAGCYDQVMVVASTAAVTCVPSGDGSAYTANATYGSGTVCSSAYTVYKGTGTTVPVTGLTNGTLYYFKVFVRRGSLWSDGVQVSATPNASAIGDFLSRQTGTWDDFNTWSTWNGSAWVNAGSGVYPGSDKSNTVAGTANVTIATGHTVELDGSATGKPINNLTINNGATLRSLVAATSNFYITLYGDLINNGIIGNGSTWNSIGFNMEGTNATISGTGVFDANRLRKIYTVNTTSNLIISQNINLRWNSVSGTTLYNNAYNSTLFNVTVNENTTVSAILSGTASSGNMAINGVSGNGNNIPANPSSDNGGGTFTVNGTVNIPGTLYATTDANDAGVFAKWIIGTTGVINCNQINCNASGTAGHTLQILNGGRLNVQTNKGFAVGSVVPVFSFTNNTYDLQAGSTVEYSAPSGITPVLTDITYSNLVISGGGTKELINKDSVTTGLTLNVSKDITISGTSTLTPVANNINVGGIWSNYGTDGFAEATSKVTFNGSGEQHIYCPGGESYYNMSVSNSSTDAVEMNTDITVLNDLDLGTNGRLFFAATPSILTLSKMSAGSSSLLGSSTALLDMSASASTLRIGSENVNYTGTLNAGSSSLVNYYRDAAVAGSGGSGSQNVNTGFTYANLSFSGSDTKITNDDFTVTGNLTIDGATTALDATAASKTLTIGGDITLSGNGTMATSCLSNLSILTLGNSLQTFSAGFNAINCYNLSTTKTSNGITLAAGQTTLAIANNLTQATASQLIPNDNRVKIGNVWSLYAAAGFVKGTSTVEYNGSVSQNILAVDYYNLESSSTGARVMASSGTIGIENAFTKGSNAYTFTGSTVNYNGSANQTVTGFTSTAATPGSTYNNLTLSASGNKSLGADTDVEGDFTLSNSVTFRPVASNLRLRSLATKTARVAPVSATANIDYTAGAGRFVVERYFPAKRSWRLVTAPVTVDAAKTVFSAWQQGGGSFGTGAVGSGMYITGPSPSAANGLDDSPMDNFSLKTYNPANSQFAGVANTKTQLIAGTAGVAGAPDNIGFFMFVRGDRSAGNPNAYYPGNSINETTLRDTGKIQIHNYSFNCTPNASIYNYTLVGNPYASPVDFTSLVRSGVANKFQAWDPTLNLVGGYVVVDYDLGAPSIVPSLSVQTGIIQSKQAVLLQSTNLTPTISFTESSKSATDNRALFRPVTNPAAPVTALAINLYTVNADGSNQIADGVLAQYRDDFDNKADHRDALKFANVNETFSIIENNDQYILQRRKPLTANDTVWLSLKKSRTTQYRFNLLTTAFSTANLTGYLEDAYLKTSTPVNMGGSTWVDFSVTGEAASAAANRFRIVFKQTASYTGITAQPVGKDVQVQWWVSSQQAVLQYEVERSADGINFTTVGTVPAMQSQSAAAYQFTDVQPVPGVYYYRIKASSSNNAGGYSDKVKVQLVRNNGHFFVFPNPVKGSLVHLQLNNAAKAVYIIKLVNTAGQELMRKVISHAGGTATVSFTVGSQLAAGAYQLEISAAGKKTQTTPLLIQR